MRWARSRTPELDAANLRQVAVRAALTVLAIQGTTAAVAVPRGRRDYADAVWGPGLAAIAGVGALAGTGDARRRWGLAALVWAWAARLASAMTARIRGSDHEDPRYTEFLHGDGAGTVVAKVFVTQGVAQLVCPHPSRSPRRAGWPPARDAGWLGSGWRSWPPAR